MDVDPQAPAVEAARHSLQTLLTAGNSPGVQYLFMQGPQALLSFQAGLADPGTGEVLQASHRFNLHSATQLWTAAAVLRGVQTGLLALDEPLQAYLPEHVELGGATVRQALLHTAGFANPNPLAWIHLGRDSFDPPKVAEALLLEHGRPVRSPGGAYRYSPIGHLWLGQVLRAVSRQTLPGYLQAQGLLGGEALASGHLSFDRPDPAHHARGTLPRWGWLNPVLAWVLDRDRFVAGVSSAWVRLEHHQADAQACSGLIGNAAGVAASLQGLLGRQALASSGCPSGLFDSVPMVGPARSLGGFTGWLEGQHWCGHAGGGVGHYGEWRVYPRLQAVSVLLLNRAGLRDEGLLGRVDKPLVAALARQTPQA